MNNLKEIDDKYDILFLYNLSIYILDNSSIYGYNNYKFYISGTISGEKPKTISINKILSLMINTENNTDEEDTTQEIDYTVIDIINDNYTLDCAITDKKIYNLQSSISIIDNELLLINFNDINNENKHILNYTEDTEEDVENDRINYKKNLKELILELLLFYLVLLLW